MNECRPGHPHHILHRNESTGLIYCCFCGYAPPDQWDNEPAADLADTLRNRIKHAERSIKDAPTESEWHRLNGVRQGYASALELVERDQEKLKHLMRVWQDRSDAALSTYHYRLAERDTTEAWNQFGRHLAYNNAARELGDIVHGGQK